MFDAKLLSQHRHEKADAAQGAAEDGRTVPTRIKPGRTEFPPRTRDETVPARDGAQKDRGGQEIAAGGQGERTEMVGPELLRQERRAPDDRTEENQGRT